MNPSWSDLIKEATGDIRRLDHVVRFNSIPVAVHESTSTHSYWVSIYAAMIHLSMFPEDLKTLGAVIMVSIVHDAAECVTGDVVRVFKYSTPELKIEVDRAEDILVQKLLGPKIQNLFDVASEMSKGDATPERDKVPSYVKSVVKAADFLSLFQYMRREAARGNLEIIPFYNRMMIDIHDMAITLDNTVYNSGFPSYFYQVLLNEARNVRDACFRDLYQDSRWTRPI